MVVLYVGAGINHFVNPAFYTSIMPPYIPAPGLMETLSGVAEIVLGLLLVPAKTRRLAACAIAIMLVIFFTVHIFMLQQAYQVEHYRTSIRMAWVRLLLQPFLIVWVMWHARKP